MRWRASSGGGDLVVTVAAARASFRSEPLGVYPYSVIMRHDHPAATGGTLDLEDWLAFPHVVVSSRGDLQGSADGPLAEIGRVRRVAAAVPTFLQALELLCDTDMLGTFPTAVMASNVAARLTSRPTPVELEPVSLHLVRHRRTGMDPAVTLVAELLRELTPQSPGREPYASLDHRQRPRDLRKHRLLDA